VILGESNSGPRQSPSTNFREVDPGSWSCSSAPARRRRARRDVSHNLCEGWR